MSYKDHDWEDGECSGIFLGKRNVPPIWVHNIILTRCKVCGIRYFTVDAKYRVLGRILNWLCIRSEVRRQERIIKH